MTIKNGTRLEVGVSEPADFFLEAGDGPYFAVVDNANARKLQVIFETAISYRGAIIKKGTAKPRYEGEDFEDWDGTSVRIVNIVIEAPGVTHLIGGIKFAS